MLEIQSSSRENKNFLYLYDKKKFYIYFVLKKYRQVSAIFTDTNTTSRYHKNRPIPPIPILKYRYITNPNRPGTGPGHKSTEPGSTFTVLRVPFVIRPFRGADAKSGKIVQEIPRTWHKRASRS